MPILTPLVMSLPEPIAPAPWSEDAKAARIRATRGRVLIVNPEGLAERGGMGRMTRYLVDAIAARPDAPPVEVLDSRGRGSPWFMPLHLARTLFRILRARVKNDVRLVHVNMAENTSALRKGAIVLFCRGLGIPTILHLHAGLFISFYENLPWPGQAWLKLIFRTTDQTIVLGELWKTHLVRQLGVSVDRIAVIPNGVTRSLPRRAPGSNQPCRLIYVGKLRPKKGLVDLFEALSHPDIKAQPWVLTLVGEGDRVACESQITAAGFADRVRFEGWLEPEAVSARLAQSDVYVLPSHYEGMPLALLEALSAGVAVVTTAVGALPEILTDGETALLVPPKDAGALHDALHRAITSAPLRETLGAAGEALYSERFTVDRFTDQILALYAKLTHGGAR